MNSRRADAAAASELYAALGRCARTKEISRSLPAWMNNELDHGGSNDSEEQLKAHEFFLTSMQKPNRFVQRNAAFCDGVDTATLQQYVRRLKAAQLGDLKAVRCYLAGRTTSEPRVANRRLFGEDQLAVAGLAQAVFLSVMDDAQFPCALEKDSALHLFRRNRCAVRIRAVVQWYCRAVDVEHHDSSL